MRLDRVRLGARCSSCPLRGSRVVSSLGPNIKSSSIWGGLVVLGESPGSEEVRAGEPFVGPAGRLLASNLRAAGLIREGVWLVNLLGCQPPGNKIDSPEGKAAQTCCDPGFRAELAILDEAGARVYLALGTYPALALGVEGGVTTRRGYVYSREGRVVIPSYHPSYLLRGSFNEIPVQVGDFRKARRILSSGWEAPTPKMNTHPSLAQLRAFTTRVTRAQTLLGLDIETTSLIPEKGEITVVGLAESADFAISVPFLRQGGLRYWEASQEAEVRRLLRRILASCPVVLHNAVFDVGFLTYHGFPVAKIADDTIVLHHYINPELPHRLSYVASVYADVEYWKDTLEDKSVPTIHLEDEALRRYNLWDAVILQMILPKMRSDAAALGVLAHYERVGVPLVRPLIEMTSTGVLLDKDAQRRWRATLTRRVKKLESKVREAAGLPPDFKLSSGDHLCLLLWGRTPPGLAKAAALFGLQDGVLAMIRAEIASLEEVGTPTKTQARRLLSLRAQLIRKEGAKNYAENLAKTRVLATTPLTLPRGLRPTTTETGKLALDEDALLRIKKVVSARILDLASMKKPTSSHASEQASLAKTQTVVSLLLKWRETSKLLSTYGKFATWGDGRVHFPFKQTGTATGRLSSGDKKNLGVGNGQNIPEEARHLFVARPGWVIIGADYSSLEPRVQAYIAEDDATIADLASGKKVYDVICQDILGIPPTHPDYPMIYKGIKTYVLCTNYGGSVETAYDQILTKVENPPFTLARLKRVHEERRRLRPAYKMWYDRTVDEVSRTRTLTTFGGRRRIFYGALASIRREALDYGPQGGAADVMNAATVRFYEARDAAGLRTRLLLQIHDALYIEAPRDEAAAAARLLKTTMEAPVDVGKYRGVVFPVEVSMGPSWGDMKEIHP